MLKTIKKAAYSLCPHIYPFLARKVKAIPIKRQRLIQEYLRSNQTHLLQLGAGPRLFEGWMHTDFGFWDEALERCGKRMTIKIYLDLKKPFPLPDSCMDGIFSEHVHEHFLYPTGCNISSECFRILKPGGTYRLATPNIDYFIELYLNRQRGEMPPNFEPLQYTLEAHGKLLQAPANANTLLNGIFLCHGHRYLYDFKQLQQQLLQIGFCNIHRSVPGDSISPYLGKLETSPLGRNHKDMQKDNNESLIVEAQKPVQKGSK